jgi:hypothetical protein
MNGGTAPGVCGHLSQEIPLHNVRPFRRNTSRQMCCPLYHSVPDVLAGELHLNTIAKVFTWLMTPGATARTYEAPEARP